MTKTTETIRNEIAALDKHLDEMIKRGADKRTSPEREAYLRYNCRRYKLSSQLFNGAR